MEKNNQQRNDNIRLFFTGVLQVYFVAINTYFLAKEIYIGVLFAAFAISMIWSYNIKKIAFGTFTERVIYSLGATIGSLLGLYTSSFIMDFLQKL
jgi:hypothetical protein